MYMYLYRIRSEHVSYSPMGIITRHHDEFRSRLSYLWYIYIHT